jgi:hypothetical protein
LYQNKVWPFCFDVLHNRCYVFEAVSKEGANSCQAGSLFTLSEQCQFYSYMDAAMNSARKAHVGVIRTLKQGGANEVVRSALSLEQYPESLDPQPIRWPCPYELSSEVRNFRIRPLQNLSGPVSISSNDDPLLAAIPRLIAQFAHMMIMPTFNEDRVVYNPVGGNEAAIRCTPAPARPRHNEYPQHTLCPPPARER